jgi:2-oxoglutarate dehydrogenase E2 component (dihydrolipoamide succinyltransferase)
MAKQVVMPQMGESVAEGTIVRWLKKVGDSVERDEPLFEISTDKVDAEIPSPSAGVLSEIKVQEGQTVPINTVVGVVDETAAGTPAGTAKAPAAAAPAPAAPTAAPPAAPEPAAPQPSVPRAAAPQPAAAPPKPAEPPPAAAVPTPVPAAEPQRTTSAPAAAPAPQAASASARSSQAAPAVAPEGAWSAAEARELRLSPVVRKIAREHHIDVRNIAGSGAGGRVTKNDILAYLEAGAPASASAPPSPADATERAAPGAALLAPNPAAYAGLDPSKYQRVPMSVMRRKIAEHMVLSRRVSSHVHSAFEVDFHTVDEIRKARKAEYEAAGGKLTYMSFITKACADALKAVPIVNASVDGADIIYKKDINIGIAVALDWGLIVPVLKNVDRLSLADISRGIADLATRARDKKLKPDDVQGGTFTITNPGVFGALFGMPIISQPQVAIVGVGAIEKRPVILADEVRIRLRAYMTIGYDHRVIDGAVADQFMQVVKKTIEGWDPAAA